MSGKIKDKHLKIDIQMSNAEAQSPEALAAMLREVAEFVEWGATQKGRIFDINGNSVGTWGFEMVTRKTM